MNKIWQLTHELLQTNVIVLDDNVFVTMDQQTLKFEINFYGMKQTCFSATKSIQLALKLQQEHTFCKKQLGLLESGNVLMLTANQYTILCKHVKQNNIDTSQWKETSIWNDDGTLVFFLHIEK